MAHFVTSHMTKINQYSVLLPHRIGEQKQDHTFQHNNDYFFNFVLP